MLKRKKVGLIIWGSIFAVTGLMIAFTSIAAGDRSFRTGGVVIGMMILLGGGAMIFGGIMNAVQVNKYNAELLANNPRLYAVCLRCRANVEADLRQFQPHARYPEGFLYCPVCKAPISRNAFSNIPPVYNDPAPQDPFGYGQNPYEDSQNPFGYGQNPSGGQEKNPYDDSQENRYNW